MSDYIIKQLKRNGKKQLIITIKDGDCDFHQDEYVIIRKIKVINEEKV